jgi:diguanylate cyclase (GGDEF)-like protein
MLLCEQADTSVIASAIDAGADDLVLKPIDAMDLRIRIGVAARVQVLMNRIDTQTAAGSEVEHDSLTGLWNREALLRMLFAETDRVQRLKTPLALILLDIDHFARINEKYGFEAGDKVLRELAKRFRRHPRSYDLVGRCGEDEFLIGLPGCTSEQAYVLIKRLKRNIFSRPFAALREQITVTATAGISHSQGRSPLVVLREAERALAHAKASGRNCERQHSELDPKQAPEAGSEMRLVPAQEAKQS